MANKIIVYECERTAEERTTEELCREMKKSKSDLRPIIESLRDATGKKYETIKKDIINIADRLKTAEKR